MPASLIACAIARTGAVASSASGPCSSPSDRSAESARSALSTCQGTSPIACARASTLIAARPNESPPMTRPAAGSRSSSRSMTATGSRQSTGRRSASMRAGPAIAPASCCAASHDGLTPRPANGSNPVSRMRTQRVCASPILPRVSAYANDPVVDLLRGVPFFKGLDRVDLARLLGALEEVRAEPGEIIAHEGTEADALYLLERGTVAITVASPEGDLSLRQVVAPAHFGELGLLLARRTATSRALTNVLAWRMPRSRFEALVRDRPQIGLAVAAELADAVDRRSREYVGAPEPERRPEERARDERPAGRYRSGVAGAIAAVALPALLWNVAPPAGLDPTGWRVVVLLFGAGIAWLAEPVPDFAVALALVAAWGGTGLVTLPVAFSGFASSSWLLALGALALAAAMARTGLLFRIALLLLRTFPATATGQLFALLFGGVLITPLVPLSVARVAAIMPVASEIGQSLGYTPRSNGSARLAFAGLVGYWYFSSIFLTGLATHFFVVQLLSPADRARFSWTGWLGAAAPLGVLCLIGATAALLMLFRPERPAPPIADAPRRDQRIVGPLP